MAVETQNQIQTYCPPIGTEFGNPLLPHDPDIPARLNGAEFADFVPLVADDLVAQNTHGDRETKTGVAAARTIKSLGCAACELHNGCSVETELTRRVSAGAEHLTVAEKATMIGTAPVWLKAARFNNAGIPSSRIAEIASSDEAALEALRSGEFDKMLGTTTNTGVKSYTKDQLPELAGIGSIGSNEQLRADEIVTEGGFRYTVVDAAPAIGSKDDITEESRKEYGILTAKLLERMAQESNVKGQPQIFEGERGPQKTIRSVAIDGAPDAKICEIRMANKNRLYFSIVRSPEGPDGPTARIVILGAHGGDEATQRKFIDISLN